MQILIPILMPICKNKYSAWCFFHKTKHSWKILKLKPLQNLCIIWHNNTQKNHFIMILFQYNVTTITLFLDKKNMSSPKLVWTVVVTTELSDMYMQRCWKKKTKQINNLVNYFKIHPAIQENQSEQQYIWNKFDIDCDLEMT